MRINLLPALKVFLRLVPLAFLAAFFFYPLFEIFKVSLWPQGALDLSGFTEILTTSYFWEILGFTLAQAAASTALTLAAALPAAVVFARYQFPFKRLLMSLATLPFVLPTVVVAIAFDALIGGGGLPAIFLAHVFYNFAVVLRMVSSFWANQSPRVEESARVLGSHGWRLWWDVRLPLVRPALIAASALVFIFTFTSFGVILMLGGLQYATLEVEIYWQTISLFDLSTAAALSLVQIAFMFLMMSVYTRLQRQTRVELTGQGSVARAPRTIGEKLLVFAVLAGMAALLFAPMSVLVWRALTVGAGVGNFANLWENPRGSILFAPPSVSIGYSLTFALITTALALVLGVLTAYLIARGGRWARIADPLFMLPLAASAVTLGFGYLLTWNRTFDARIVIPMVHTLVALPFVVRSVLPALRALPPHLSESARVLGATPLRVLWAVELPLISRAMVVGGTFAFTVSIGEFGASLFLARPDTPTMPVVIYRLFGQPGVNNYGQALAMSVLLMLVCALSFIVIERLRTAGVGEF